MPRDYRYKKYLQYLMNNIEAKNNSISSRCCNCMYCTSAIREDIVIDVGELGIMPGVFENIHVPSITCGLGRELYEQPYKTINYTCRVGDSDYNNTCSTCTYGKAFNVEIDPFKNRKTKLTSADKFLCHDMRQFRMVYRCSCASNGDDYYGISTHSCQHYKRKAKSK